MMTRQNYITLVHSQPVEECETRVEMRAFNWPIVLIVGGCVAYHLVALYCIAKVVASWGVK